MRRSHRTVSRRRAAVGYLRPSRRWDSQIWRRTGPEHAKRRETSTTWRPRWLSVSLRALGRILLVFAALLSSCAVGPDLSPIDPPLVADAPSLDPSEEPRDLGLHGEAIALAFSGGGARAAATAHGLILGLRAQSRPDGERMIDQVAFVTAVSGGSVAAAWFGLYGPDGQDGFRAAYLDKNWRTHVHTSLFLPQNWARLAAGGLNGRDRIADWLEREVYTGKRMSDLRHAGPPVMLNAAELYTGTPFVFASPWFDALCAKLGAVRVADAVAGSMAYPLGIRPVVLESYSRNCPGPMPAWVDKTVTDPSAPEVLRETARALRTFREPERIRYVHVVDGGLLDNFGLAGLSTIQAASGRPYGPMLSAGDAVRLTGLTVLVLNAERTAPRPWGLSPEGPNGRQIAEAVLDHFIDTAKRNGLDAFSGHLARWERQTIAWRCSLSPEQAHALGAPPGWNCADLHYRVRMLSFKDLPPAQAQRVSAVDTDISLPSADIEIAVQAGKDLAAFTLPEAQD